VTIEVTKAMA